MDMSFLCRVLREVRSSLEAECAELKRSVASRDAELSTLSRELAEVRSVKDSDISQLQAEVKLKTFEATALGATYEVRHLRG